MSTTSTEKAFQDALKTNSIGRDSICLIGLSGGGDSVSLLALAARTPNLTVHAARVAHGIRDDAEEEAESLFCRNLCSQFNIPFTDIKLLSREIDDVRKRLGCGTEQAARQARLFHLEQLRHSIKAHFILLGHTADDQLETILMRLLTGSGPEGLKGIPIKRGRIIRPLLFESRKNLRLWLKSQGIQWAEDPSNDSRKYRRNRIRNDLIPLLTSIIPGWEKAALILAERSKEVQITLETVLQNTVECQWTSRDGRWSATNWDTAPRYIKAMVLWEALNRIDDSSIPDRRFPWETIVAARRILDTSGKWMGFGVSIHRQNDYFVVRSCHSDAGKVRIVVERKDLIDEFNEQFGSWSIRIGRSSSATDVCYHIRSSDWPILLELEQRNGRVFKKLSGRGGKITRKSDLHVYDDVEAEKIYIEVDEYVR